MRNTLGADGHELGAIDTLGPSRDRIVGESLARSRRVAKDVGPLLDALTVVIVAEGLIIRAVVDGHLWPLSSVAGIGSANLVTPGLSSLGELSLRALRVPQAGAGEASERHTGKGGSSLEDIGVGSHEYVRHHGTRRGTGGKDTAGVAIVSLECVLDHVRNSQRITTGIVREGSRRSNIPALARVGSLRVDDNEAILISKALVGGSRVVSLRCASAVVHGYENRRVGLTVVWDVDVHESIGGVGAKVVDSLKGSREDSGGGGRKSGEKREELHFGGRLGQPTMG